MCNSDGYVGQVMTQYSEAFASFLLRFISDTLGLDVVMTIVSLQVCLLNIKDEPMVEACIAVCSARIICIAAVPGLKARSAHRHLSFSSACLYCRGCCDPNTNSNFRRMKTMLIYCSITLLMAH